MNLADLPPNRRAEVEQLLREVPLAPRRPDPKQHRDRPPLHVCYRCGKAGRLGSHHRPNGDLVWIHDRCHRKEHRREGHYEGAR